MSSWGPFLALAHVVGLILAVGAATVKLSLLLMTQKDVEYVPVYLKVARPVTRFILAGTALLVLSGIGWLAAGYPFTTRLLVKLILVASTGVLGSLMGKMIEPAFVKTAPVTGGPAPAEFVRVQKQYILAEALATGLFYAIILMWMLK